MSSLDKFDENECLHRALCTSKVHGMNHDMECPMFRDYSHADGEES